MIIMSGIRVLFGDETEMSGLDFPNATDWIITLEGALNVVEETKTVASFDRWIAIMKLDALAAKDR